MQSTKTLLKFGALKWTGAIGIVLNHSGSKHLPKGDGHTFQNGANAFENRHELIIQADPCFDCHPHGSLIPCPAYSYSSRMIHMYGNLLRLAVAVFLRVSVASAQSPSASNEAAEILVNLIKINTSNPPGNETQGAQYIKNLLEKEGIVSEIFESAPGRGNIVARLKGSGKARPLMLMAHLDV